MVSALGGADPASVSRLGGALRSEAAALARQAHDLAPGRRLATVTHAVSAHLDLAGAALQAHAQELAELAVVAERLASRTAASGLALQGWRVAEPYGPTSTEEAARRQADLPDLQAQADRLASRMGRSRAALERALGSVTTALAASTHGLDAL